MIVAGIPVGGAGGAGAGSAEGSGVGQAGPETDRLPDVAGRAPSPALTHSALLRVPEPPPLNDSEARQVTDRVRICVTVWPQNAGARLVGLRP